MLQSLTPVAPSCSFKAPACRQLNTSQSCQTRVYFHATPLPPTAVPRGAQQVLKWKDPLVTRSNPLPCVQVPPSFPHAAFPTPLSGEVNASSVQRAQILIRPQCIKGEKRKHKTINSWLLVLAPGKGRCTAEREETETRGGWDLLQEPQGDSAGSQTWERRAPLQQVRAQSDSSGRGNKKLFRQHFF